MAEHETLYGSKPSPTKSVKKASRCSTIGVPSSRKFSVGGALLQDSRQGSLFQQSNKKGNMSNQKGSIFHNKNVYHSTQSSGI